MKYHIVIFAAILFLFSCQKEYHRNKYKIVGASFRFLEWQGKDSMGCEIVKPASSFSPDSNIGVAIKLMKEYYSDSTFARFWGIERLGIDGTKQQIKAITLKVITTDTTIEIGSFLIGKKEQSYLSQMPGYEGRITEEGCVYTEKFANIDSLIASYNRNDDGIIKGEYTLEQEILFWISDEGKNSLSQLGNMESANLKIALDSDIIVANR